MPICLVICVGLKLEVDVLRFYLPTDACIMWKFILDKAYFHNFFLCLKKGKINAKKKILGGKYLLEESNMLVMSQFLKLMLHKGVVVSKIPSVLFHSYRLSIDTSSSQLT